MKKILALAVIVGAAVLVLTKVRSSRAESDLWHEATSS